MKSKLAVSTTALLLALTGCAAGESASPAGQPGTGQATVSTAAQTDDFLRKHGLDGIPTPQLIETLDVSQDDRREGIVGSVRPHELMLSDGEQEVTLPIEDRFYLSIAPYETRTHDCFYHNLATCQGELTETPFEIRVVQDDGTTVFEDTVTSYANGFAGMWLPRDIQGTLTVRANGKQAEAPIATGPDDLTCLTTLQLA